MLVDIDMIAQQPEWYVGLEEVRTFSLSKVILPEGSQWFLTITDCEGNETTEFYRTKRDCLNRLAILGILVNK